MENDISLSFIVLLKVLVYRWYDIVRIDGTVDSRDTLEGRWWRQSGQIKITNEDILYSEEVAAYWLHLSKKIIPTVLVPFLSMQRRLEWSKLFQLE